MKSAQKTQVTTEPKSNLITMVENIDKALARLDVAIDKRLKVELRVKDEPQLELPRNEREINKKVAAKLDQTIHRLETILTAE